MKTWWKANFICHDCKACKKIGVLLQLFRVFVVLMFMDDWFHLLGVLMSNVWACVHL